MGAWVLAMDHPWLEGLGARFSLALDGLSMMLIGLTAFINVICILIAWEARQRQGGALPLLSAVPGRLPHGPLSDHGPSALLAGDPARSPPVSD
jgi:hypothetical protein